MSLLQYNKWCWFYFLELFELISSHLKQMGKSIQALSLSYWSLDCSSEIQSCPLMCPSASFFRLQLSFHIFPMKTISLSISLLQISELVRCSHLELLFLDCDKWATSQHFLPFRLQGRHLTCPKLHLLFPWLVKVLPIFVTICIVEAYQSMASLQDFLLSTARGKEIFECFTATSSSSGKKFLVIYQRILLPP